jgi:hypothetical protein
MAPTSLKLIPNDFMWIVVNGNSTPTPVGKYNLNNEMEIVLVERFALAPRNSERLEKIVFLCV